MCLRLTLFLFLLGCFHAAIGQNYKAINVEVVPDHPDWIYQIGETVKFKVRVLKFGIPLPGASINYEIGPELREATIKQSDVVLKTGETILEASFPEAGFLTCTVTTTVEGEQYKEYATVGFEPFKLIPFTKEPDDFDAFWQEEIAEMRANPLTFKTTLMPEAGTARSNVYEVEFSGIYPGAHYYAILTIPKKEGKYPVVLMLPGAGVWPEFGANEDFFGEKGVVIIDFRIHGIPLTLDPKIYEQLRRSALSRYWNYELRSRENYYMKKAYLGCIRAIDLAYQLPEFDGENLVVTGGSQGGALTIVTAGLDERVDAILVYYPAFADLTADVYGNRTGGWPRPFKPENQSLDGQIIEEALEVSAYYDVVNFARRIQCEGRYSWGFRDLATPPSSTFATYNVITAPKTLQYYPSMGHHAFPEAKKSGEQYIINFLNTN